jgi:predicted DNA-binding protein with PD1-like motif
MASREDEGEKKISQIFDDGMKIFEDVSKSSEATNSSIVQVSCIGFLCSALLKTFQM